MKHILFVAAPLLAITPATAQTASQGPMVTPAFRQEIPNVAGKSLVASIVEYAPGAKSPPHRHANSAFIAAYVLSGSVRSQVNDEPVKVYKAGESWFEAPGAHHRVSENASMTEPARMLAIFVVDSSEKTLTTRDPN
jgi:quercetin dioxygenase-like cupin family protein